MAGRYKAYSEYKDSGITWTGQVPSHWSLVRFKHVLAEKKKTSNPSLPAGSISFGEVIYKSDETISPETKASYQEVLKGEFLVNPLNMNYDLLSLRTALSSIDVVVSTGYIVLRSNARLNPRYARWLLQEFDVAHMKTLGSGVRQTINYTDIGNSFFFEVPESEQKQIARFLDHETGKIDALIEKQQALIALLQEKRQAVISHAVTKGLTPEARMKDSGVELLGQIPTHWETNKFRYLFNLGKGLTITKENLRESGVPCVNYGEVHSKYGFEVDPGRHPLKCVSEQYILSSANAQLTEGDLIFADTSEDLEGAGNFTQLVSNCPLFAGYHTIIARPVSGNANRFLAYLLDSPTYRTQIRLAVKGVKVFSVTQAILRGTDVWLPPLDEQTQIAQFLDHEIAKIDQLIEKAEYAIELMQERRTALISAAVTGKIDVRDWTAPEAQDTRDEL